MRKTQAKKLRKAIRDSLSQAKMDPEKYADLFNKIYKQAKKEFKGTPWNKKDIVRIT